MNRPWLTYTGCLFFIAGGGYMIFQGRSTVIAGSLLLAMGLFTLCALLWQLLQRRRAPKDAMQEGLSPASLAAIKRDAAFRRQQRELQEELEDIKVRYGRLRADGNFTGPAANALLSTCESAMRRAELLKPKWRQYGIKSDYCGAFKACAVIYEKRGEHMYAAQACVRAIRGGFPEDGCDGGMSRRLAHLMEIGDFRPTAEMLTMARQ